MYSGLCLHLTKDIMELASVVIGVGTYSIVLYPMIWFNCVDGYRSPCIEVVCSVLFPIYLLMVNIHKCTEYTLTHSHRQTNTRNVPIYICENELQVLVTLKMKCNQCSVWCHKTLCPFYATDSVWQFLLTFRGRGILFEVTDSVFPFTTCIKRLYHGHQWYKKAM